MRRPASPDPRPFVLALLALALGTTPATAQLGTLFELNGRMILDTNGDSVPDFIGASLLVGDNPSTVEMAAAAEVAARLGFETMAMDLPLGRDTSGDVTIVIGRSGLAAAGASTFSVVDPTALATDEGAVAVSPDGLWVNIVGGGDEGLLAAARLFAGVLPHTRTLSTGTLEDVRQELVDALTDAGLDGQTVSFTQARTRAGTDGIERLVARIEGPDGPAALEAIEGLNAADARVRGLDAEEDDEGRVPFVYPGLGSLEVDVGGRIVRLEGRAEPDTPGPISGRPGSGNKGDLDLSNLYTGDGLLGGDPIPNRVDAIVVPGNDGISALPELTARLGLEATGFTVPLVHPADDLERPGSRPVMVLAGADNRFTTQLADSGKIDTDALGPGEGLIELVPDAFGSKSALVVTGGGPEGAERALEQVSMTFPNLADRGKDRPTVDAVEQDVWDALAGYAPVGQAAIGLYKLDRIGEQLAGVDVATAEVLMSVEKADPGLVDYVQARARQVLGTNAVEVVIDDRDVQNAAPIFNGVIDLPSEVDEFWTIFRQSVLPAATSGAPIVVEARLSEPPEVRRAIEEEAMDALIREGADRNGTVVHVQSAFKQGFYWLTERIRPQLSGEDIGEIVIRFRRNDPPPEWPQQAIHTPLRWLHEIFPVDEVLARELDIDLERIRFEQTTEGPTYHVVARAPNGATLVSDTFEPEYVLRPYFDRFADYEHVRVTTGHVRATAGSREFVNARIRTDPEAFWDYYQAVVLPALYDHVMDLHEGLPNGGSGDAPYFGELTVELEMSEPDYRLEIDNEIHATMDALHEEVYFGTIEFFDLIGRNSRGQGLTFPGRIIPRMRPKSDGSAPVGRVTATGFATSRPAVIVSYETTDGESGEARLDIPKTGLARPSARLAKVEAGTPGLTHLAMRVRVDTEFDMRDSLLNHATPQRVDASMVSAAQVARTMTEIEELRAAGLYPSALAYPGLGTLEVWAEWTHEQDAEARTVGTLAANGTPDPLPDWRSLLPDGWEYGGERLVQWETPIPPPEGHEILAKMAVTFEEATMYRVGESYLGKDIWALDLMSPIAASHWSHVKATTYKPTVIYSARQHANEVSSTSHVLRHAELLLTDAEQRPKLEAVNVIVHPFTNPDGAQLAYDLYTETPDYILHAGYLGPLGQDITSGGGSDHPIYPESAYRGRLWERWLPDIFLNPHGYPSHQVVQLFSEYTGLVRRGRVTERNWGFNKGWFMPGFGYVDSPQYPRHKDAAFTIRDYITRGINSNEDVFDMNQRNYARYTRYGADSDPDVFRLPMTDSVLIEMPLKGSSGGGGGYNPRITIWSGTTEAPDETAYGPWMELVAKAGLSWDQAITDYLFDGNHEVNRSGSRFFGGVTLRLDRPRPPDDEPGDDEEEATVISEPGGAR